MVGAIVGWWASMKKLCRTLFYPLWFGQMLNTFNEINMILHTPPFGAEPVWRKIKNWFKYQAVASALATRLPWNWPENRWDVCCTICHSPSETTGQPWRKTARVASSLLASRGWNCESSGAWEIRNSNDVEDLDLLKNHTVDFVSFSCMQSQWPQGIPSEEYWKCLCLYQKSLSESSEWGWQNWPIGTSVSPSIPSGIVAKNLCSSWKY